MKTTIKTEARHIPSLKGFALSGALRMEAQDIAVQDRADLMLHAADQIDSMIKELRPLAGMNPDAVRDVVTALAQCVESGALSPLTPNTLRQARAALAALTP